MSTYEPANPALQRAYQHCAGIIKGKAHSFYFASRFLPHSRRDDVYALYAFCRTIDDIADLSGDRTGATALLERWRDWLLAGAPPRSHDPIAHALGHTVRRHDLPLTPLLDLLDGVRDDLQPRHLPDTAALDHYCYRVAGTVGIVMAVLLGADDPAAWRPACDLGIAMQLTNVLRDVGEDLARGRIYLPASDMQSHGYERGDLERAVIDDRFVALMRRHITRARDYYERGLSGLALLPPQSRFPIALAAHTYAGILTSIERGGFDVFTRRARTTRREKLLLAARLFPRHGALRLPPTSRVWQGLATCIRGERPRVSGG